MDFVVDFPRTLRRFDAVWVIVDKLKKSAYFILVMTSHTSKQLAKIYIWEIVRLHGVPISIISNHDTQFILHFWRAVKHESGMQIELSTTFHPQMDGQFQQTIQILDDMLRACNIDFTG